MHGAAPLSRHLARCADNHPYMKDQELAKVRAWAQSKIDALEDPDWTLRRCQHIVALVDDMLGSQAAFSLQRGAPQFAPML